MTGNNWENFGEEIKRTIQDAVQNGNYDRLNETISNTINQASEWVNRNIPRGNQTQTGQGQTSQRENHTAARRQTQTQPEGYRAQRPVLYNVSTAAKVMPAVLIGGGALVGIGALLPMAVSFLEALFWFDLKMMSSLVMGGIGIFFVWLILVFIGIRGFLKIGRFKKYVRRIGYAEYCTIADLSAAVKKTEKYVTKDLEKMIKKGWFVQGHLDRQKTCIIITDQMYKQYKELEVRKDNERIEAEKAQQKAEELKKTLSPEVQKVLEKGDYYLKKLRECDDAIPGEVVSQKIVAIGEVVKKIFDRVKQNPASVSDIRKLMEYYLPTTVKLLEAYAEMDAQPVGGTNIQNAKQEIEATLDTLNVAFEKLLDSLFEDTAWDVSTDISVLNTMLAQEGLKDDGMK